MDTQLTLVDFSALPEREASTLFTFSRDSLLNTTIHLPGTAQPTYVVQTNPTATQTKIFRRIPGSTEGSVLAAQINRNDFLPDKIMFAGGESVKTSNWLSRKSFCDPFKISDPQAPRFVWKPTNAREIALYAENMPFRPIAWFRASIRGVEAATLALQEEAESMQDAVLASLIIVEQRYRVKDKRGIMASTPNASMPIIPS